MSHVKFAAVVAVALMTSPLPQFVSAAHAQQQPSAPTSGDKTKKEPSAAQSATRERQKKCAAEWKEAKASGKIEKGATWPKFWSACNKRLKAASN